MELGYKMAIIAVPTMAAFENDLITNVRLLEELVLPSGHEGALEIIGKPDHFIEKEGREKMIENLKKYARGMGILSHQWSGNIIYDPSPGNLAFADLRTERGSRVINAGVQFAEEAIQAGLIPDGETVYVHTHGGDIYFGPRKSERERHRDINKIKDTLTNAGREHPRVVIGLENIPTFPNSDDPDLLNSPNKVGRSVFECLEDYKGVAIGTDVELTFDTSHYSYDRSGNIDLVKAMEVFGPDLRCLHVGDIEGFYIPGESMVQDGLVPGEGRIGRDAFKELFGHLKESYDLSKIGIEAEAADKDYRNPVNRKEAVRRIVGWLN